MRENQELMLKFVKIVERYPEIYDSRMDEYRQRHILERAWDKIVVCVRRELNEECTAEELKTKWKGIRTSLSRYKNKLYQNNDMNPSKKYYLYDSLRFLDPFVNIKGPFLSKARASYSSAKGVHIDDNDSAEYLDDWGDNVSKPDLQENEKDDSPPDFVKTEIFYNPIESDSEGNCNPVKKRKRNETTDEQNEDLQFFRSILPDIKHFSSKEKRMFKVKILKLIDEIEDKRKEDSSSE